MTANDATKKPTFESAEFDESLRHPAGAAVPAAAWASAFLIFRVFAVSGYDWDTAFAVSTTLGLDDGLTLLFGSFMAGHLVLSLVLMFVLPLLIAAYLWLPSSRRPSVVLLAALGLAALVALTASFRSWWLPLVTTTVLGTFALIHRLPAEHRLRRALVAVMARVGSVGGVGLLFVAVLTPTPWVPHEHIETTGGTISGYVLGVDSGYLNVLTDEHEFVILISGDVLSRD